MKATQASSSVVIPEGGTVQRVTVCFKQLYFDFISYTFELLCEHISSCVQISYFFADVRIISESAVNDVTQVLKLIYVFDSTLV